MNQTNCPNPASPLSARILHTLVTPPSFPVGEPKLKTNLDTDLLKMVAILSMLMDHVGSHLFPEIPVFRWIGRLAFPLFCYCMTVGLLYTHDIKKYLTRLGIFAVISQPFYILATHPFDWQAEWSNWNIFFTLFISLLAMYGLKERKWWLFLSAFLIIGFFNFDYSTSGIILMLIFYLCRNKPALGAALFVLNYLPALWSGYIEDPLSFQLGGLCVDWTIFALLAAPLIFTVTHSKLKINKYIFYVFYPAHLLVIGIIRLILGV